MKQFETNPSNVTPINRHNQPAPAPRAARPNYKHDFVPYPPNTPMMEIPLTRGRVIIMAKEPQNFDPDYQDKAKCLGAQDLFFTKRGESDIPAKEICNTCQVRCHCLEDSLQSPLITEIGIWGGTTQPDRKKIKAARDKLAKENESRPD